MDKEDNVIEVRNVYKDFKLPHEKVSSVKGIFTNIFQSNAWRTNETQHALKNISFSVKKGEFFGIVGRNGSGKSTLLKILAGIYQANKGSVGVKGKLVPFIELGVGFNPELTGRENVYLNGALLGFSRSKVDEMYQGIVDFAELERFMDQKLKNYSSGMQVRLAFSMAIRAEADILLVDEVLAVGDADFQRKCFDYFRKLKKDNKTVIFVTHDMGAVIEYCDRAVLINDSRIVDISDPKSIATQYTKMFNTANSGTDETGKRWGDGKVKIKKVSITPKTIKDSATNLTIEVQIMANEKVEEPVIGFLIKNAASQQLLGTNTKVKKIITGVIEAGATKTIAWTIPNIFGDGKYLVDTAISHSDGVSQYDWWEESASFRVYNEERTPYSINPQIEAKVT